VRISERRRLQLVLGIAGVVHTGEILVRLQTWPAFKRDGRFRRTESDDQREHDGAPLAAKAIAARLGTLTVTRTTPEPSADTTSVRLPPV
jgi:hypothetical protein